VARADELTGRHIERGELGCPVCDARYPVLDGVVDFSGGTARPLPIAVADDIGLRAAALLGITGPGGLVVLVGEWSAGALGMLELTENVHLLAVDFAEPLVSGGGLSLALVADKLPLAAMCARGVALDAAHATPEFMASAVRALVPVGRILAPASAPVPPTLREIARDEHYWVAATGGGRVTAPVGIRRPR
jgi:hypothetical protein